LRAAPNPLPAAAATIFAQGEMPRLGGTATQSRDIGARFLNSFQTHEIIPAC
jgi:hypothetical protein